MLTKCVDIIGVITQTWDEKGESHRWIQTRSTPTITAGSRYKYLKPRIPFGYAEFVKALGEAIDKEQENGAVVVDTIIVDEAKKMTYDEFMTEAKELWMKLIQKDEENANRISKKIEMIFGRKIKLSEITEDQVELGQLVLLDMQDLAARQGI